MTSMKPLLSSAFAVLFIAGGVRVASGADEIPEIIGEYVEARTCDVWTGPCFANAELNTTGEFAVLGWSVTKGTFEGEDLTGLKMVAAIRARGTLMSEGEGDVKTIVFVDRRATAGQSKALVALGRKLGGKYFKKIIDVRKVDIAYSRTDLVATLEIKDTLKIQTTALHAHCDTICGNEEIAYPTIAKTSEFHCAKTIVHYFKGDGLKARWSDPFKRSAMVGIFSL